MRIVSVFVAAACIAACTSRTAGAQVRSPAIETGTVVRLRSPSPGACREPGSVVAVQRDSAIVELPVAQSSANGATDCSLFGRRTVSVADLDVFRGPSYGGRHGAFWGLLLGPPAGALIGLMVDAGSHRSSGSFAPVAGGAVGLLLGPVVGGIVGAFRSPNEWTPAAEPNGR